MGAARGWLHQQLLTLEEEGDAAGDVLLPATAPACHLNLVRPPGSCRWRQKYFAPAGTHGMRLGPGLCAHAAHAV